MWIIDAVTKTDKYITGYISDTRFGKRSTLGGRIAADIDGKYNYHIGNDYNTPQRTKLYAPCDVEVLRIVSQGHGNGYGYQLFLYMIDYDKTLHLAHLNEIADIKVGEKLKEGTFVAYSGGAKGTAGAGTSTGSHLHLGIANGRKSDTLKGKYMDGTWINPSDFKLGEKPSLKPVDTVAKEVIDGKWGNGNARKTNLEKAGYNYNEVQKRVNELLGSDKKPSKPAPKPKPQPSKPKYKTVTAAVVNDVILGKYGNGAARKTNLEKAGYNYNEVQSAVNKQLGAKVKPEPKPNTKTLKRGSKVKTTATRDIFGTRLDKSAIHPNRTFTVEQIGRNGNMNHILLKEVMTWVHKDTVKVV